MRLISSTGTFVFELSQREREVLATLLRMYPLLNPDYHQGTKAASDPKLQASQAFLHEAMAERKAANKKLVQDFLADGNWTTVGDQCRVTLAPEKMEWLLEVLNDVRVGSWVRVGCPDTQNGEEPAMTPKNLPYLAALELGGLFQSAFLQAIDP